MANIENLKLSRNLLHRVIEEKRGFNIEFWVVGLPTTGECGSTACLGGWMALDPAHNVLGLKSHFPEGGSPEFEGLLGFGALAKFWDVTSDEVLFIAAQARYHGEDADVSPEKVLARLDALILQHEPASA